MRTLLERALADDRRKPDGKLHPSGDLIGSLRHSQLRAAGAPTIASEITSDINLMTGTLWHEYFEKVFRSNKLPVMTEIQLDRWLPKGWGGTADWLVWNRNHEAFELMDLKTTRPEAMKYIEYEGIKEEHMWQLSAYWYALERMGLPILNTFKVFYLPKYYLDGAEPLLCEGTPLPEKQVAEQMSTRWAATKKYLAVLSGATHYEGQPLEDAFRVQALAPEQERIHKIVSNVAGKVMDVKLTPHWTARYCPYPVELCACDEQKTEKIGHYRWSFSKDILLYVSRKGYQGIAPTVTPTKEQEKRLREWANSSTP